MTGDPQNKQPRKTFGERLKGSLIFLAIIAFLLGLGWVFVWWLALVFSPPGSYEEHLLAQNLPPRDALAVTDGRVVEMGYYSSRRTQFVKPKIEYTVAGKTYRAAAINAYASDLFPFRLSQTAQVLYVPAEPERAWQKWEYDQLIDEYEDAKAGPLILRVKTIYNYIAVGILALCALLLTINLFVPFVRYFIKGK